MSEAPTSDENVDVSGRVVEKVADVRSISPLDLSPPLYDVVDPEALNTLFRPGRGTDTQVTFEYLDCEVTVDGTGYVDVEPPQQTSMSEARIDGGNEPQEVD